MPDSKNLPVVSLMAGMSSRLKPLTDHLHKVMIEIGGKRLLDHQLQAFNEAGITDAVFVVGHQADLIVSAVGDHYKNIPIKYVYNSFYNRRNINYSLYLAEPEVKGRPFIYLEGDILFHASILKRILESPFENCLAVEQAPRSDRVDTLVFGRDNNVWNFAFREHGHFSESERAVDTCVGEPILIIKFGARQSTLLFEELARSDFEGVTTLYNIFNECFKKDRMHYILAPGDPWIEIDNHEDLSRAREMFDQ
jgi:choline kinase